MSAYTGAIAATNRDLEAAIQRGEFREGLFYRFNTFTITLPPLRERGEDMPVLAYHFLRTAAAKVNKKVVSQSHLGDNYLILQLKVIIIYFL